MSRKLLAGTVLLGAGILTAVFSLSSPPAVYARSVSDFVAQPIRERTVRVSGTLVHGSLLRSNAPCGYLFRLADGAAEPSDAAPSARPELSVHYGECIVPDTFRDVAGYDLQVTVEGELCANCHRFEASQVITKCTGKYWAKVDGGHGCPR